MLNSTCNAFQSNLKLPMRFICMTWPLHNILFKVLDEDSLSWKFTTLAIKSKRHKWSSKKVCHMIRYRMLCWPPSSSGIVYHRRLFCSLCFSKWLMLLIFSSFRNKQQGMKLFGSLEHLWNTSACSAYAIQLHCQYSLEISDEITMKTAITICVSRFTRPLLWVVLWVWLPCVYYHQSSKTTSTLCL